jgi:hypothetical protein
VQMLCVSEDLNTHEVHSKTSIFKEMKTSTVCFTPPKQTGFPLKFALDHGKSMERGKGLKEPVRSTWAGRMHLHWRGDLHLGRKGLSRSCANALFQSTCTHARITPTLTKLNACGARDPFCSAVLTEPHGTPLHRWQFRRPVEVQEKLLAKS